MQGTKKTKELVDEYILSIKNKGRSQNTVYVAELFVKDFLSFLFSLSPAKKRDIRKVNKEDLKKYFLYLKNKTGEKTGQKLSASFKNQMLFNLKNFFGYLTKNEYIMTDISINLERFKEEDKIPRNIFNKKEIKKFFNVISLETLTGRRDYCMFRLLYHTGLRRKELAKLTIRDINLTEGQILVKGKFSKQRIVPLGRNILQILKQYLQEDRPKLIKNNLSEESLFPSQKGAAGTDALLYYQTRVYAQKAGLKKNITPHSFRHTFATHLLNEGASIRHVQEILGHENLHTTQVYTRVALKNLRDVYDRSHPRALPGQKEGKRQNP